MIRFRLNGNDVEYKGDGEISLLKFLRNEAGILSVKDGCSAQSACGACLVEADGRPRLSCVTKMKSLEGTSVLTLEGVPEPVKKRIGSIFVQKGAVQCGFCTPGFIMRTKILLQTNPDPDIQQIREALKQHLCRCTGYKKIEEAIQEVSKVSKVIEVSKVNGVGMRVEKYQAYETAVGERKFVCDLEVEDMLFGVLRFSNHPRAKILQINTTEAEKMDGVIRIFTADDIPGHHKTGLIFQDWPLMVGVNETTCYMGDVVAGVVAINEETARKAAGKIHIEYEILKPVTDPYEALKDNSPWVHEDHGNLLENCIIRRGEAESILKGSAFRVSGTYRTRRVEHAFLEMEAALALPDGSDGLILYSQGQGVYEDRRQVAMILGIPEEKVRVIQVCSGGGFGGKEDMTVQGHAALFAWLLKKPVKVSFSREESITMHPKRHPVWMDISLGCDAKGMLTALKLRAVGDSGAYASVGTKVMERVAGHATGGYYVPVVDIESKTVYTNNIPSGAMRGFGVNQAAFALESCIDELCAKGGFDRWQFRYDNALVDGLKTAAGQKLQGTGIRKCLLALKDHFYAEKYTGLACGIKNSGVGNGMPDFCEVIIDIHSPHHVTIHHGWTEMGQGVHTIAIQTFFTETGLQPEQVDVVTDTAAGIQTGMTTSSRATALLGNAIIDACKKIKKDLEESGPDTLSGKRYLGIWICDWTTKPGAAVKEVITHYSYGYAAQLVVLDEKGEIKTVWAAHDAGKIMNPVLFEGQIEGAVHMGLGYALTEELPMKDGRLISTKLRDCGVLRAHETPEIRVIGIEVPDPVGPYGAKGIGEIGLVPTAAAVANALCQFDGLRRTSLPMKRKQ
ncbi:MAG: selenium-dependent xanthine dehydrogenase [Bacteroidetes bacterium]|nr:selenium-dependent xanthine dehydrogenase [Bacteroidota bacterium]